MKLRHITLSTLILTGCASAPRPAPTPPVVIAPAKDPITVTVTHECHVKLHGDPELSEVGRSFIDTAGGKWRKLTHGKVDIVAVYDLDFENLDITQSVIIPILSTSELGEAIDRRMARPGARPVAVTSTMGSGAKHVFLIIDRIDPEEALSVITHELGHVCDMPDLPGFGSIMSGGSLRGAAPVDDFTDEDIALCREHKYCD